MKCLYCETEMEKGTVIVDDAGCVTLVYHSEEDAVKKGFLNRLKRNPIVFLRYRRDKMEAYHCKHCKKVITVLDEI